MKVLVADDDLVCAKNLESTLKDWKYEVITVNNGNDAWQVIQNYDIRLAILDWMMPGIDGVNLCKKIRNKFHKKTLKYIYIIMITGKDCKEDLITGISAGANDYMTKPFDPIELKIRLRNAKHIIELEDYCLKLATYDSLTKIWNRDRIFSYLEEERQRGLREKGFLGILMIDIDYFKNINDTYGHFTGDKVLSEIASLLKKSIRAYDKIGRYGGDEFIIILPNRNKNEVKEISERLRLLIANKEFKTKEGLIKTSISLGGYSSEKNQKSSLNELIKTADKALYTAKNKGRNCAVIA